MKKIMCLILFVSVVTSAYTQGLHVASGGTVYVSPKSYVYVGGNLDVSNADSFTVVSDATDSASLLINSTASGDVTYERHIPTTKWHFVSAPVTDQSINDFATNAANDVKQNTPSTGNNEVNINRHVQSELKFLGRICKYQHRVWPIYLRAQTIVQNYCERGRVPLQQNYDFYIFPQFWFCKQ